MKKSEHYFAIAGAARHRNKNRSLNGNIRPLSDLQLIHYPLEKQQKLIETVNSFVLEELKT